MIDSAQVRDLEARVRSATPSFWANPGIDHRSAQSAPALPVPGLIDLATLAAAAAEARDRLDRAQPLLRRLFPEVADTPRPTWSPLIDAPGLAPALGLPEGLGRLMIKADHLLPVAGSVKARGGFHEVIAFAERLAVSRGLIRPGGDLLRLADDDCGHLFADYSILVGSTGNLGLSIGLMARALGFRAVVHMSADAKEWKKQRLRDRGVEVVEHAGDYAAAVEQGRREAEADPLAHFVDDERSIDLFVGYSAAAGELHDQLTEAGVAVDADHPLFVHIPCGVGGAPGGIAYGLKALLGDAVHCLFAEPVAAPCMLVQMMAGMDRCVSVYDIGLDNRTEADGLAVGQASMLVAPLMQDRLDAIFTVSDDQLYDLMYRVHEHGDVDVEPSAAAGFAGPLFLARSSSAQAYLAAQGLADRMGSATHVVWTTGGSLVPEAEMVRFQDRARRTTASFAALDD